MILCTKSINNVKFIRKYEYLSGGDFLNNTSYVYVNYLINNAESRLQAVLTVPAAEGTMYDTILKIIKYVKENSPSKLEFNKWFGEEYSTSRNVIYNSRKTLERANLLCLTADKRILVTKVVEENYERLNVVVTIGFLKAYHGMLELIEIILKSGSKSVPTLFNEYHTLYQETYNTERLRRTSYVQFNTRVRYLSQFGLLKNNRKEISLNKEFLYEILEFMNNGYK
jgi:hypothetical protein